MELIEREAAKAKKVYCEERHEYVAPVADLDWLPTIDAAPVVHGRWVDLGLENSTGRLFKCSACGHPWNPNKTDVALKRVNLYPKHCPNCGARMDGGEGHETD